jgi:hypothetical protein
VSLRVALLIAVLTILACPTLAQKREPVITLQRTACLGTCPVYSLEIFADGLIRFVGTDFVQYTGERRAVVSQQVVENLIAYLLKADYFTFQDSYETCKDAKGTTWTITDLPTAITSLRVGTARKTVRNYACAPKRLGDVEDEIDRVANTKRWIGTPPPRGPIPTLEAPLPTSLKPPAS